MASRRPGPGELLAGASGFLLVLAMFLPWFGVDSSARLPGSERVITVGGGNLDAWEAFGGIDVVLALAGLLAIALLIVGFVAQPPGVLSLATIGAAALAALLIVLRLIDAPEIPIDRAEDTAYETGRRLGAFLGLLCTAGMAWGANLAAAAALSGPAAAPAESAPAPPVPAPHAPARPAPARPAPARPAPARPAPAASPAAPRRSRAAPRATRAPASPPALTSGPLGGWTRPDIDAECEAAWRRYDRRLGARYTRYFAEHPELAGEQRASARDLSAALPPGFADLAEALPGDAWERQHLSGKSSQTLAVGLLGAAVRTDPSLTWLGEALGAPFAAGEPVLEFEHVVDPSLLGERPRQTSFDVLVDDQGVLIGIEAKWRERGVGACLCRGDGVGPLAGGRCSSRVERREAYWDAAAQALGVGPREPGGSCPISPLYETVRHAAALRALAGPDRPAGLAMLYDADNPYFGGAGDWPGWPRLLAEAVGEHSDPAELGFVALSWQELVPRLPLDERARAWAADKHGLE